MSEDHRNWHRGWHRHWNASHFDQHADPRLDPNIVDDGRGLYVLLAVLLLVGLVGGALYIDGARQLANHEQAERQSQEQATPPAGQR